MRSDSRRNGTVAANSPFLALREAAPSWCSNEELMEIINKNPGNAQAAEMALAALWEKPSEDWVSTGKKKRYEEESG